MFGKDRLSAGFRLPGMSISAASLRSLDTIWHASALGTTRARRAGFEWCRGERRLRSGIAEMPAVRNTAK